MNKLMVAATAGNNDAMPRTSDLFGTVSSTDNIMKNYRKSNRLKIRQNSCTAVLSFSLIIQHVFPGYGAPHHLS
ncbi:hypothetical protein [Macrococcus carouselicus]|uniref:Uncharacterized protein n=1 Tax=Macrococcus carouselicus TaxID=69969 RepID=A0A9Q8CKD0_9STAP|nr:hypothetical protein [Macrococcus carouselicus]TDL96627.1 hypothetical protein ERX40_09750 [Macrococcus carouselicus]